MAARNGFEEGICNHFLLVMEAAGRIETVDLLRPHVESL
jgi:hypothetical protein